LQELGDYLSMPSAVFLPIYANKLQLLSYAFKLLPHFAGADCQCLESFSDAHAFVQS
jgi:hypothetical protein